MTHGNATHFAINAVSAGALMVAFEQGVHPTDFARPTNEAIGLIDLPSMAAYEEYRRGLAEDPEHKANIARLEQSGASVVMHRSFIRRVEPRS